MAIARRTGLALLGLAALLTVVRAVSSSEVPLPATTTLAAFGVLAAVRPWAAWLVLCGTFPLSSILTVIADLPWHHTATSLCLSLTFLAGWLLHAARTDAAVAAERVATPLAVYASLVVASMFTIVLALSAGELGGSFPSRLQGLLARDFVLPPSVDEPELVAFRALVALGLFAAASVAGSSGLGAATSRMLVAGLTAAAALNVTRFIQVALATGDPYTAALRHARWMRINVHYPDLNAAGAAFALAFVAAIGHVRGSPRFGRTVFGLAMIVLLVALWLVGSRVALASTALATAAMISVRLFSTATWGRLHPAAWLLSAVAFLLAGLVALWMLASFPRVQANTDPASALAIRLELLSRAGRMIADAPLLGIGVGRFYAESLRYSTPRSFGPENAHNMFAQVAAELGLLGLAGFLWVLGASLVPLAGSLRRGVSPAILWTAGGLLAYILSGLGGHPLIVFEAAVPFWIFLGIVAGATTAGSPQVASRARRWSRVAAVGVIGLLAVSVPIRAQQFIRWRHLNEVNDAEWQSDSTTRYRDVGHGDVIFVPPPYGAVILPLKLASGNEEYGEVLVALDGVPANRFTIRPDAWTPVRLRLPPSGGYDDRRVELKLEKAPGGARLLVGRVSLEK